MAMFCQSCGVLFPTVASETLDRASQPYFNYGGRLLATTHSLFFVAVLFVMLLVGGVAATYLYNSPIIFRTSFGQGSVTVTKVHLWIIYPGSSLPGNIPGGYFGDSYQSVSNTKLLQLNEIFTVSFALFNSDKTPHYVISLTLAYSPGFSLVSTNPSPSRTLQSEASMTFTVTLQAPNNNYLGVVDLALVTQ